jgi:antirestriction protein ArdC
MSQTDHRTDCTAKLRAGIAELTSSTAWERYLRYQSAFHAYSFGNVVLIAAQRPDATRVAGYRTWQRLGRRVRRGERAIWILAPVRTSRREPNLPPEDGGASRTSRRSDIVCFRAVPVFDIGQTEGSPPPEVVHRLTGSERSEVYPALCSYADELGYVVVDAELSGGANGECDFAARTIRVASANAVNQRIKTLAHELAHALLHADERDRALAELEAESVAFVVCAAVGLDTSAYSFGYVASWAGGGDVAQAAIRRSGERIGSTASAILRGLERVGVGVGVGVAESPTRAAGEGCSGELLRTA